MQQTLLMTAGIHRPSYNGIYRKNHCKTLGVDGVDDVGTPLPNVVVDQIKDAGALPTGAAYLMGNAMVQTGKTPQEIAEEMSAGKLEITKHSYLYTGRSCRSSQTCYQKDF